MSTAGDPWQTYRDLIDRLVRHCHSGQGSLLPKAVRKGPVKPGESPENMPLAWRLYRICSRLTADEREDLALLLETEFQSGASTALLALHEAQIPPFENGYEGTPSHDFVGRLDDWEWPDRPRD